MKNWKCKVFGHKWKPVFIKAEYNGKVVKFISCYCSRCFKGYNESLEINKIGKDRRFGTYSEKYFDIDSDKILDKEKSFYVEFNLIR